MSKRLKFYCLIPLVVAIHVGGRVYVGLLEMRNAAMRLRHRFLVWRLERARRRFARLTNDTES